jgi:hypothetical protein
MMLLLVGIWISPLRGAGMTFRVAIGGARRQATDRAKAFLSLSSNDSDASGAVAE